VRRIDCYRHCGAVITCHGFAIAVSTFAFVKNFNSTYKALQ
jgi:hypothetical protein